MKKIVLIFSLGVMVNVVYGQIPSFTFGPQIGWFSTKLTTNLTYNLSNFKSAAKTGFDYGAFFRFGIDNYFQPEIFFSTKGGIMNYDIMNSSEQTAQHVSQDIIFRTIDIPVLFGHSFMNSREFNLRAFLGPVASFIVDKKFNLTQGNNNDQLLSKSDFKNAIWAGQVGAGFDLLMLTFNVRYEFELNDLSKSPNMSKTRNNLFLLSLGFKF